MTFPCFLRILSGRHCDITSVPCTGFTGTIALLRSAEERFLKLSRLLPMLLAADTFACTQPADMQTVQRFGNFSQVSPGTGIAPSFATVLTLWQQEQMLCVHVRADDPEPSAIVARQMRRDVGGMLSEDRVAFVLDVDGAGRNGYFFAVNALGAQYDGLVYDGSGLREDWDARWESTGRITEQGWEADIAIPLSVLGHGQNSNKPWRLNAERWIARRSELSRLAGISPDKELYFLGEGPTLPALHAGNESRGLRIKPSLRTSYESDAASGTGDDRYQLQPALELFHESKSGLRTTAAFNIDFGEAEVDERVVNLSRFELFLPEKREFFLRDAGRFSFGGLGGSGMPYYSRRIGLDDYGRAHSLDAGLKLTGRIADMDYGVLGARVADGPTEPGLPDQPESDVTVLRLAQGMGERHRLGIIGTSGNPEGSGGSYLGGVDYQYRRLDFLGNKTVEAFAWAMESENTVPGRGRAYGGSFNYPNLGPTGYVELQRMDENFQPALGYLAESGVENGNGSLGWWHRTEAGTDLVPGVDWDFRHRLDDSEHSWSINPEYAITNAAGDTVMAEVFFEEEQLANGYNLLPNVYLPAGLYRWNYLYTYMESSRTRPVWGHAELRAGDYYDGKRNQQVLSLGWQTSPYWAWELSLNRNDIALPDGRYTVKMASARLDYTPSTTLNSNLLVQWDNVSHQAGISARLRWLWSRQGELILAVDHLDYSNELRAVKPAQTRALLKLVWNLES